MGEKWKLSHERPEFQGMFFGGILVPAQFCGGFFDKPLTFSDPVFLTTRMTHGSCHKVFFFRVFPWPVWVASNRDTGSGVMGWDHRRLDWIIALQPRSGVPSVWKLTWPMAKRLKLFGIA